ncbi:hypothetical protein CKM354_000979000 [Cercospora kikuchii]|uniref:Uncharacterized protein n=1 Tax=Cercospora kikuchii TaxID=84275 RepID=A0A9P3CSD2_9PEZI|nr:uncharacterized protein CKM354_000979000 [Cercospora kikuchii]GIZ46672.1 hypothetical protein CKM354_000979000 [Cercospora kikuchii]
MSQVARLEALLDDLSKLLKRPYDQRDRFEEEESSATPEQENSDSGFSDEQTSPSSGTSMHESSYQAPSEKATLSTLLENAIDKTASLFAIEPPRSPGAESHLSYSLEVNSKYRVHMDKAPERAVELEKDLRAAKAVLGDAAGLVEECKSVASKVAAEQDAAKNLQKALDSMTLEERRERAGVKSECFI